MSHQLHARVEIDCVEDGISNAFFASFSSEREDSMLVSAPHPYNISTNQRPSVVNIFVISMSL